MFDRTRLEKLTPGQRKLLARQMLEASQLRPDDHRLVAYLLLRSEGQFQASDLRQYLAAHLPAYMVPAVFVVLNEFPRSPSGKVDRKAVPVSGAQASSEPSAVPPCSDIEEAVARVWQDLLGLSQVGANDNFFDLGGHSLLLVRLQSKLRQVLRTEFKIVDLFRYPTVRSLANAIQNRSDPRRDAANPSAENADDVHRRAARHHGALRRGNSGFDGETSHE